MSLATLVVGGLFAQWIDFEHSLHAQHVCSRATGVCRTTAHAVFVVGPNLQDARLDELEINGLDGSEQLGYVNWEKHVVNGVCGGSNFTNCTSLLGSARVYNWGYEKWESFEPASHMQESISVRIRVRSDSEASILLPQISIPFVTTSVPGMHNSDKLSLLPNDFSTCAYQDGSEIIFHIVFSVAPVEDPIENLTVAGEYSIDSGSTWHQGNDIFFEDHIDLKNGSYFQSFQFDGRWTGYADNVCFRVVASDSQHRQVRHDGCMQVCKFPVAFHNAGGYCSKSDEVHVAV